AAIDAVLAIREELAPAQRDSALFHVRLSPTALQVVGEPVAAKRYPTNVVEAQFSLQFLVALAWLDGHCQWDGYSRIGAPDILALAERVEVGVDAGLPMAGANVRVETGDEIRELRIDHALGEPSRPLSWEQLETKFMSLAAPVYGATMASEM